jgi:threonylcarbamoyladenosine tRNA methylthiotransferase MtaB
MLKENYWRKVMKKVAFCTLGCKVNQYDSQAMLELFLSQGYEGVAFEEKADVYVINTCTVTATADKKSRQMVSRAKRQNPQAIVIAAGCLTQNDPEALAKLGVDAVVGMNDRQRILALLQEKGVHVSDLSGKDAYDELHISAGGEKTRGFVKIQEGCNNFCSYCIIPYVRGPALSRNFAHILDEAKRLGDAGVKEIVLTGIHIDSYGVDTTDNLTLTNVIEAVDRVEGIQRIRLGSLEPGRFSSDELKRLSQLNKLCPHFHVSLQSGSDTALVRMNRHYTAREYAAYIDGLRNAFIDPAITTDIIAGFVQETDVEHQATLAFARQMDFSRIHVFAYSRREGTAASRLTGEVPKAVKQARVNELIEIGKHSEHRYLQKFLGQRVNVLFEAEDKDLPGNFTGYTERYVEVSAPGAENEIQTVSIEKICGEKLIGRLSK